MTLEKKIARTFIVFVILILLAFSFSQRTNILNFIFPQGDSHFYLLNTENQSIESKFVTFHGKIIWGTTFFSLKNTEYFGYIEAFEDDDSNFSFYFKYAKVHNLLDITEIPIRVQESEFLKDLTVHYVNETPIFTTVLSKGNKEALLVTSLLQFALNGTNISEIIYMLPDIPVAKILDVTYFKNDKFMVLTTLGEAERLNDKTEHILCYSMNGSTSNNIEISEKSFSLAFHKEKDVIYTSGENSINIWDLDGYFKETIKIRFTPSDISIRNMTHLLIKEYRNNYTGLLYVGATLLITSIPLVLFMKYSKRRQT